MKRIIHEKHSSSLLTLYATRRLYPGLLVEGFFEPQNANNKLAFFSDLPIKKTRARFCLNFRWRRRRRRSSSPHASPCWCQIKKEAEMTFFARKVASYTLLYIQLTEVKTLVSQIEKSTKSNMEIIWNRLLMKS